MDYLVPFVDFVFRLSLSRFTRPIETYSGNPPPLFLTVNMNDDRISDRIAFGSCNEQDLQNNLWPIIESRQPTAFVWGGDAIYADTLLAPDWSSFPPKAQHRCATPSLLRKLYQTQRNVPAYRSLLRQNLTVFGTFDDHDYGCNNADRTYPYRYESGMAYVDFLGLVSSSPMYQRAQAGHGVYGVKLFDFARPKGEREVSDVEAGLDPDLNSFGQKGMRIPAMHSYSNRTVAVFVLDVRTNKTPWKKGSAAYQPDLEGDFLGERQWQWFEAAIARSTASVNVVVNGLQVHANRYPDGNIAEAWGKYPKAQQRLFDAILQDGVESPVLVSGDVHMTQLMRKDCYNPETGNQRSLIEMTTSGMTHSWGTVSSQPLVDPTRKPSWRDWFESYAATRMVHILHTVCPWTDLMVSESQTSSGEDSYPESGGGEGSKQGLQYSLAKNFGELEFDWDARMVSIRSIGEDPASPPLLMARTSMDRLSGRDGLMPGGTLTDSDFAVAHEAIVPGTAEWVCVNHRGAENYVTHMFGHVVSAMILLAVVPFPLLLPALLACYLVRCRRKAKTVPSTKLLM